MPWTENIDYTKRQRHALHTLVTAYLDNGEASLREAIFKIIDGLSYQAERNELLSGGLGSGFFIKSLMFSVRYMDYEPALKLAGRFVRWIFTDNPLFTPDNTFRHGGHMHGNLKTLAGAADYALYVKDPVLYSRVDAIYRYVRSESTRFGFLPEVIGRKDDIIPCETCAIMDYLGLAITLANHGHPEYWGDVERVARNNLIESQVTDVSWLKSDPTKEDTEQSTWRDVGERMVGGYAGWSSPNHILAARQTGRLSRKARIFQNCCGGSGTHAFFMVWKNASRFKDGCLWVNMHIDKLLPQAEIRCYQPYKGLLTIELKQSCRVKVRIPEFVNPKEMRAESDKGKIEFRVWGNYIELEEREAGERLEISYPIPIFDEEVIVGNPGFRQYRYRVTWKGDTVVRIEPLEDYKMGYYAGGKKEVPIYYGTEGPGALYLREYMLRDVEPELAPIHLDDGCIDLWFVD